MAGTELDLKAAEELRLLAAFINTISHVSVQIPDGPLVRDRHVYGIWPAINQNDTVFAK